MCNLFVNANSDLWKSKTKSLRISGFVTSIRMENVFWSALKEIAFRDKMTVNELISTLYSESLEAGHDEGNFTSFLRVCAIRYYSLMSAGEVSLSLDKPIFEHPATQILQREAERRREGLPVIAGKAS